MNKCFNISFHDWCFSEKYAFSLEIFRDNNSLSDQKFVSLISDEFNYGSNRLIEIESSMLLVGLAKISGVTSEVSNKTLGEIIVSDVLPDSVIIEFIDSHRALFSMVWLPRKNLPFVVESFRVYWDNMFIYGGDKLRLLLDSECILGVRFRELVDLFDECSIYSDLFKKVALP